MSASATERAGILLRPAASFLSCEPGLYLDVPFSDYLSLQAASNSFLCDFERSPANAAWSKAAPEAEADSSADLGTLVHTLALEPDSFASRYVVAPTFDGRTNAGKADKAAFYASCEAAGLTPIDQDTMRKADLMVASMFAHPEFARLLRAKNGYSEVSAIWRDDETGVLCKARYDRLVIVDDGAIVLDLKTTSSIEKLHWAVSDYGYDRQEAHYTEGLHALGFPNVWFFFGFVSSVLSLKKYPVRFVQLNNERKAVARMAQRSRLVAYKHALEFNDFYGVETI